MLRRQVLMLAVALVCAVSAPAWAQFTAADTLKAVVPGLVYKEYSIVIGAYNNDWRVTDPNATNPGHPGNSPADFLPNPVLAIPVDDLQGALKVVAIMDVWGGHVGTIDKRFRLNEHDWISIPDIANTPASPECYTQQYSVAVEVPISHLLEGTNALEGTSGGQTCYGFGWGQWGWYSFMLRVYYDPGQKTPPTGAITAPASGAVLAENPDFAIAAGSAAGISRVDVVGYYENHDYDGDGIYLDWQQSYHRLQGDGDMRLRSHMGTSYNAPHGITWNTQWIPDQVAGGIKAVARIRDGNGLWFVTDQVTGLTLSRPHVDVRLYKAANVPTSLWVRAGETKSTTFAIPAGDELAFAQSARLDIATWNGADAGGLLGQEHWTRVNDWTTPEYGAGHFYSSDSIELPLAELRNGTNTVTYYSRSDGHGIEIPWPGPTVIVRYANPPATIVTQPADALTIAGLAASFSVTATGSAPISYQWQRNGVDIEGAVGRSYTTTPPTTDNDGDLYRCRVTNAVGSDTSLEATLTVLEAGPRNTAGQVILYKFNEGSGDTVVDQSGVGAPADLVIADQDAVAWIPGALSVTGPVVIATATAATKLIDAVKASNELTIEAWLKPATDTPSAPAGIVNLSSGLAGTDFTLGQGLPEGAGNVYDVRLRTTGTGSEGLPSLTTPVGDAVAKLTHVVYTRDAGGVTRIHVDGIERAVGVASGDLSNWDETFPLVLAGEWNGELHLVALFDRALPVEDILRSFAAGPTANTLPVAAFTATPTSGAAPLTVQFDAAGSTAAADSIVSFLWQFGDGGTAANVAPSRQYTTSGNFTVTLTVMNSDGAMALADTVIVVTGPPFITAHPSDRTVTRGETAGFTVTGDGLPPLAYQWQRNGGDIPGATDSRYTTPPTLDTDNGAVYRCVVSNPHGSVTSNEAVLTVQPPIPRVTAGLLALYTFREGGGSAVTDVSGVGAPLDLSIADPGAVTWSGGGLRVDAPTLISSPGAATKVSAAVRATHALTVEAWITPANTTQLGPARIVSISADSANRNFTLGQGLYGTLPSALYDARLRTTATNLNGQPDLASPDGSLQVLLTHVVYTRDAGGTARIFIDGVQSAEAVVGGDLSNWDEGYRLALANEIAADRPWLGAFHLVAMYDRALTPEEVSQNFSVGITASGVAGVGPDGPESGPGGASLPREFALNANYPNPFNPRTTIAFDLPAPTVVSLRIFDVSGRLVDVLLADEARAAGRNEVAWQGRDRTGRVVSAGIYFYRLDAGGFSDTKRMTLIK